jgi:APA family basic amino acid/polyamine antiporter
MLSLVAIFGILPNAQLQSSSEPFSTAANAIFGGTWAGDVTALLVTTLVLITGITAAIPYLFSALAQLKWRLIDHKHGGRPASCAT